MTDVENKEPVFIKPLSDSVFKTMLLINNDNINEFYKRIINHIAHIDITDYHFEDTQMTLDNYKSIFNKMDILMVSSDNKRAINIEANRRNSKSNDNKNNSYILGVGRDFYRGKGKKERYKDDIHIAQINLNDYLYSNNPNLDTSHSYFYDPVHNIKRMDVEIYDVYLPVYKDMCYSSDNDILKDLAILAIESFEEGDKLAQGNKEREAFMSELKKLGSDESYIQYYDIEEYEEAKAINDINDAREEGISLGIEQKTKEAAINMIKKGFSKQDIIDILNIKEQQLNQYLN